MTGLCSKAWEIFILLVLDKYSLMSINVLADNGYTTIFHPHKKGVTVHNQDDIKLTITKPALLQGGQAACGWYCWLERLGASPVMKQWKLP